MQRVTSSRVAAPRHRNDDSVGLKLAGCDRNLLLRDDLSVTSAKRLGSTWAQALDTDVTPALSNRERLERIEVRREHHEPGGNADQHRFRRVGPLRRLATGRARDLDHPRVGRPHNLHRDLELLLRPVHIESAVQPTVACAGHPGFAAVERKRRCDARDLHRRCDGRCLRHGLRGGGHSRNRRSRNAFSLGLELYLLLGERVLDHLLHAALHIRALERRLVLGSPHRVSHRPLDCHLLRGRTLTRIERQEKEISLQRRALPRNLPPAGVPGHADAHLLEQLLDRQPRLPDRDEQMLRVSAIVAGAVFGHRPRRCGKRNQRARGRIHLRKALRPGTEAARERIVAAGIEDHDVERISRRIHFREHQIRVERVILDLVFALDLGTSRG